MNPQSVQRKRHAKGVLYPKLEFLMAYQTIKPTTNKMVNTCPNHTDKQIEDALTAAHSLYKSEWFKGSIKPRLKVLHRLADIIESPVEDLAKIITLEMGKLIGESRQAPEEIDSGNGR